MSNKKYELHLPRNPGSWFTIETDNKLLCDALNYGFEIFSADDLVFIRNNYPKLHDSILLEVGIEITNGEFDALMDKYCKHVTPFVRQHKDLNIKMCYQDMWENAFKTAATFYKKQIDDFVGSLTVYNVN